MRAALGAFAMCFGVLALAAAPSLHALDSGELVAAGVRLGLSHPPGQPAHALLVKAATLVPLGDVGFRANLLSAACAALAAALLAAAARKLGVGAALAVALGLAVAWSGPCVENATRAEVYTPALAAVAAALLAAHAAAGADRRGDAAAGLAAGLAACLHPAAGIAVVLAQLSLGLRRPWRAHALFAAGTVAGALPLVTVLLRAHAHLPIWDAPRSLGEAVAFWTGAGYAKNFGLGRAPVGLAECAWLVARGSGGVLVLLAIGAAVRRRDLRAGALLVAALLSLAPASPVPFVLSNPDLWGYGLPAMAMVALAAARGARGLPPAFAAVLLVPVLLVGGGVEGLRPRTRLLEARVEEALEALPPRAVLVAESDTTVGGLAFLQAARGTRPDVAWVGSGIAGQRAPWARVRAQDAALAPLPRLAPVPGDARDRAVLALLALAHGRVPCLAEDRRFARHGREHAGWVELGPGDPTLRGRWARLSREVRGDETAEQAIRTQVEYVAAALAAQGEPQDAARALLVGLAHPGPSLRRAARALPATAALRPEPPDGALRERFAPDERTLLLALARLSWRAGRPDEAARLLERDGSDEAAAQLAFLALAEGRADDAQAMLRALIAAHPEAEDRVLRRTAQVMGRGELGP